MKSNAAFATGSSLVLAMTAAVYAGDYTPTQPVRPSAGYFNDWLRKDNAALASWDVGMQMRLRYEIRDNFGIAGTAGSVDFRDHGANVDNAYFLHRFKPHVGYAHEWFNVFIEGRNSGSTSDKRNPNPESDGFIDLHQAYVMAGNHKEFPVSIRVGRQDLIYGDERLIGASDWNNLGRVFDAAKVRYQNQYFGADFFSGRVVLPFDNHFNMPNDYDWFSGVYASTKKIPWQMTELYFLSRNVGKGSLKEITTTTPTGGPTPRDIYTIGLRVKSNLTDLKGWDYTAELMGQFGHFNDPATLNPGGKSLEHRAYAVFAGGGYTWLESDYKPRLGLEYNFASGDSNPNDGTHETFENLFPTNHKFYGYMDFVSLQNIHNLRFTSSIKPLPRLTLKGEAHAFWLADTHDNFYAVSGARRGGITATGGAGYGINPGNSSYVGSELDFVATYAVSPQATVEMGYGHFFRGDYIKQSLSGGAFGSKDANWFYLSTTVNF